MEEYFAFYLTAFIGILVIVDPFAAIPLYLTMTATDGPERRRRTARIAAWTVLLTLTTFAVAGGAIFRLFGVSLGAFRVAGGSLLFLMSLDMLRAQRSATRSSEAEVSEGIEKAEVGVVPLGIPMLAGPGAIATVTVLMGSARDSLLREAFVLACIAATAAVTYVVLRWAVAIEAKLHTTGLNVLTRLVGLLVAAIAVQFIADGLTELFPVLARGTPHPPAEVPAMAPAQ
ncbi:MAG: MarC family protein [Tepidisphaerales bacterium]